MKRVEQKKTDLFLAKIASSEFRRKKWSALKLLKKKKEYPVAVKLAQNPTTFIKTEPIDSWKRVINARKPKKKLVFKKSTSTLKIKNIHP